MKKSAPKIQESSQERSLRQYGTQLANEAQSLKAGVADRAAKIATADNTSVLTTAAAGANAKSLSERLKSATSATDRVNAVLGSNTAQMTTEPKAVAGGVAERLSNMTANVKRGLGVTGTVVNSLSQQSQAAQQAAEIEAQSKMQAQAAKMKAVGDVFGSVMEYRTGQMQRDDNKKFMDKLLQMAAGTKG